MTAGPVGFKFPRFPSGSDRAPDQLPGGEPDAAQPLPEPALQAEVAVPATPPRAERRRERWMARLRPNFSRLRPKLNDASESGFAWPVREEPAQGSTLPVEQPEIAIAARGKTLQPTAQPGTWKPTLALLK